MESLSYWVMLSLYDLFCFHMTSWNTWTCTLIKMCLFIKSKEATPILFCTLSPPPRIASYWLAHHMDYSVGYDHRQWQQKRGMGVSAHYCCLMAVVCTCVLLGCPCNVIWGGHYPPVPPVSTVQQEAIWYGSCCIRNGQKHPCTPPLPQIGNFSGPNNSIRILPHILKSNVSVPLHLDPISGKGISSPTPSYYWPSCSISI